MSPPVIMNGEDISLFKAATLKILINKSIHVLQRIKANIKLNMRKAHKIHQQFLILLALLKGH